MAYGAKKQTTKAFRSRTVGAPKQTTKSGPPPGRSRQQNFKRNDTWWCIMDYYILSGSCHRRIKVEKFSSEAERTAFTTAAGAPKQTTKSGPPPGRSRQQNFKRKTPCKGGA